MEYGTLERELYIDATPAIVYDVVSRPEHVQQWWPDEAHYTPTPGATGHLRFGDDKTETITVVTADPPHTFTFRWTHPAGETPTDTNSLLVTFTLRPHGTGTLLTLTETGFRERGWNTAVLEQVYNDHVTGWNHFLPRINPYTQKLTVRP